MVDYNNSKLIIETAKIDAGKITWRSPSNLAIIKYWGKYGQQMPRNASISFTLDKAFTETSIEYSPKTGPDEGIDLTFYFDGVKNEAFGNKLLKFLGNLTKIFPFLKQLKLVIKSTNSFPHSSGIASSASSMSAIALCLCSMEEQFFGTLKNDEAFRKKASFVARLGSGSACRSVYEKASIWGEIDDVPGSSNYYGIAAADLLHPNFHDFHDAILIVSTGEKAVSSTAGHALMEGNLFAEKRYLQAKNRFQYLISAFKSGDFEKFGQIAEGEALTLHALMMMSTPPYILMKPNSLAIIDKVRRYREETKNPLYFSLDAGPNLHLLYPDAIKNEVKLFIESELLQFCEREHWIDDKVGLGPLQL